MNRGKNRLVIGSLGLPAAMLLAACAANSRPQINKPVTSTEIYDRDAAACEREAALSSAGSKAETFSRCMRAKNHAPVRP